MDISNKTIEEFSEKIYGFAYDKTRDCFKAEDLAHDIIIVLLSLKKRDISNMDGYIYTVCCYTWANYLRKDSKNRRNLPIDEMELSDGSSVENETENKVIMERMCREISRLSKNHRNVTVMFYFNNLSCEEISERLGMNPSTVRWYLGQSRKKIREGIDMNENLSYVPVSMYCGHDGWSNDMHMHGLNNNVLVQNIVYACYGEPVTIEEISRKLNVAAAYLEFYIDDLVYMDYLKKKGNKYQTNFYIRDKAAVFAADKYSYENIGSVAEKILGELKARFGDIIGIGFMGCELNKEYLLWNFFADCATYVFNKGLYSEYPKTNPKYKNLETPLRKDGTRHWVCATLKSCWDNYPDKKIEEFGRISKGNGIKTRQTAIDFNDFVQCSVGNGCGKTRNSSNVFSIQFDYWQNADWREFNGEELLMLARIREIILSGETPNSYDISIISKMAEQGYVKVENEIPSLLVPFMTDEERKAYEKIREDIRIAVGIKTVTDYYDGYGKMMDKIIPDFLDEDIRQYHKYSAWGTWAAIAWVRLKGLIKEPDETEQKAAMTMLWLG